MCSRTVAKRGVRGRINKYSNDLGALLKDHHIPAIPRESARSLGLIKGIAFSLNVPRSNQLSYP